MLYTLLICLAMVGATYGQCVGTGPTDFCNPGSVGECCPNTWCNFALRCISCINAQNTTTCTPNAADTTRCCDGLNCVNGRCVDGTATTAPPPADPTTAAPTVAPTQPPAGQCIGTGPDALCSRTPDNCCVNTYCNFALRCISCINAQNTTTCVAGAADTTACCAGLNCVNGRCVTGPADPTQAPTTTAAPTTTTAAPTTTTPAPTTTTAQTCVNIGLACSKTPDNCCPGLVCTTVFGDICIGAPPPTTTAAPTTTTAPAPACVTAGQACTKTPNNCCAGLTCTTVFADICV